MQMSPRLPGRLQRRAIDALRPSPRNPRTHDAGQIDQIVRSVRKFGWTNPLLIDATGEVIAGDARWQAAKLLGMTEVPVIVLGHLTAAERDAYRIADNRIALNAGWDEALLAQIMRELATVEFDLPVIGFDDAELSRLVASLSPAAPAVDADDEDPELPRVPRIPVSRSGDLWCLGHHRLLCGDSTDRAAVDRLMDGTAATLLFTSPPYGNQRDYTTGGISDWDALMKGVFEYQPVAEAGQVLVNLGLIHRDNEWLPYWQGWLDWMRAQGWRRFALYVWDQGPGTPGDHHGRLASSFELIFHFNRASRRPNKIIPCISAGQVKTTHTGLRKKDGSKVPWSHGETAVQPMRIPDNVLRIMRHKANGIETEHPAVFPVKLPEFVMQAYSDPGDVVYDPFSGSGTSIIAGERSGRRVRTIDLAPEYVDVAVMRYRQLYPDRAVTLDGEGWSFEETAARRGVDLATR